MPGACLPTPQAFSIPLTVVPNNQGNYVAQLATGTHTASFPNKSYTANGQTYPCPFFGTANIVVAGDASSGSGYTITESPASSQ